jgi:hypothetical protein
VPGSLDDEDILLRGWREIEQLVPGFILARIAPSPCDDRLKRATPLEKVWS